jgi:hypothetical protein
METDSSMSKPDKPKIRTKSGQALKKAKDRTRTGLDRGYEAKRPFAKAMLFELRATNPEATPTQIQNLLDTDLLQAEKKFGTTSAKFSSAATLYVMASVELRELDIRSTSGHQKLVDLMVMFDSAGVRYVRRAVTLALIVIPFLRGAKLAKIVTGAAAVTPAVSKVAKKVQSKYSVADFLVTKTNSTLGSTPTSWPNELAAVRSRKRGLRRLWK